MEAEIRTDSPIWRSSWGGDEQKLRRLASPSLGSQNHVPSTITLIKVGKRFNSDLQLGSPQSFRCMVSEEGVNSFLTETIPKYAA
jgi:hypothetical protein